MQKYRLYQIVRWRDAPRKPVEDHDVDSANFKPNKERNWWKGKMLIAESTPKVREKLKQAERRLELDVKELEKAHIAKMQETNIQIERLKHELAHDLKRKTIPLDQITIPRYRDIYTPLSVYTASETIADEPEVVRRPKTTPLTRRPHTALPLRSTSRTGFHGYDVTEEEVSELPDELKRKARISSRRRAVTATSMRVKPMQTKCTPHRVKWT